MFFFCQVRKGFVKYIPIVGGIPDSLSCYPDSKAQKSRLLKQNFPDSGKRIPLHECFQREAKCKTFLVKVIFTSLPSIAIGVKQHYLFFLLSIK